MGAHIVNGEFQSDKYPTCPPGKVPLSVKDPMAQDLLWEYAQRRRKVDPGFSHDLELVLSLHGYTSKGLYHAVKELRQALQGLFSGVLESASYPLKKIAGWFWGN